MTPEERSQNTGFDPENATPRYNRPGEPDSAQDPIVNPVLAIRSDYNLGIETVSSTTISQIQGMEAEKDKKDGGIN